MSLGTFVVNMPDGKYYLKTTMSLAFTDSGPMEWMTGRIPLVKDMIIRHLQSISVEQLENLRYRQILKNDLMIRLNSLFPNEPPWEDLDPVKRILFTEFYKQ
jgi:flagellar FliL protein